jgi:hypothetical protein
VAILIVNYVKKGKGERQKAKATIRYMQHRPGKDKEKTTRVLFGSDGLMGRWEAYRMIDEAAHGSNFFRIIINPDVKTEDTKRDLNLRDVTARTMHELEERFHAPLTWVGVVHADHTPQRHIHALAIARERLLPVHLMRQTATQACVEQRHERDLAQQKVREQEGAEWEQEQ